MTTEKIAEALREAENALSDAGFDPNGLARNKVHEALALLTSQPEDVGEDAEQLLRDLHRLDLKYHEAIESPYIMDMTITRAKELIRALTREPRCPDGGGEPLRSQNATGTQMRDDLPAASESQGGAYGTEAEPSIADCYPVPEEIAHDD